MHPWEGRKLSVRECVRVSSRVEALVCLSHVTGWRRRFQQPLGYKIASWAGISGDGEAERGDGEVEPTCRMTWVTASRKLCNDAAVFFSIFFFFSRNLLTWSTLSRMINNRSRGRTSRAEVSGTVEEIISAIFFYLLKGPKSVFSPLVSATEHSTNKDKEASEHLIYIAP